MTKNRPIPEVPTDVTRTRPGHEPRMTVMCNTALIVAICKIELSTDIDKIVKHCFDHDSQSMIQLGN